MSNTPVAYTLPFDYKNRMRLIETLLNVYAMTQLQEKLSDRQAEVLRHYVLDGYNSDTKDAICIALGINSKNLNTINYSLQKKGILNHHPTNQKLKILNADLEKLKEFIEKDNKNKLLILSLNG